MDKHEFTFMQGAQMFAALLVLVILAIGLLAANPDIITSLIPQDSQASVSNPVYVPIMVNTPVTTVFMYELTQDQFVPDHHQLVCNEAGVACDIGIYRQSNESFEMGMTRTVVPYNETTMTVFPHVDETLLEVGQTYAECTLTTYALTVNGASLSGCFEGIFQGVDSNGYHFLVNGQIWSLPHTHGGFLTSHSN